MQGGKILFRLVLIGLGLWGVKRVFIDPQRQRALRAAKKKRALPDVPDPSTFAQPQQPDAQMVLNDGALVREAWVHDEALLVLGEILTDDISSGMRTSIDLANEVARRYWRGLAVTDERMQKVKDFLKQEIRFEKGPHHDEAHEAAVVVACRAKRFVPDVVDLDDDGPTEPLAVKLAQKLFPSLSWDHPTIDWQPAALGQLARAIHVIRFGESPPNALAKT